MHERNKLIDGHEFNTTQLKASGHGRTLHRDYSAHFFRWSFVRRHVKRGSHVLDVGCGQELPLYNLLTSKMGAYRPASYTGVDLNQISKRPTSTNVAVTVHAGFNVLTDHVALINDHYDVVVCLEVIEHMSRDDGTELLDVLKAKLTPGGRLYLSTPAFNGQAAKNHVHEYTPEELGDVIQATGLKTLRRFGTFANLREIRNSWMRATAEKLSEYFDDDAVSCICGPMLDPDLARNNLWVITKE